MHRRETRSECPDSVVIACMQSGLEHPPLCPRIQPGSPHGRDSYLHSTIRIISEISNKYLQSFNGSTALSSEMPVCMKLEISEYLIKSKVQLGALHLVGPLSMVVKTIQVLMLNLLDWHRFKMYVYLLSITLRVCLGARGPSPLACYHCHSHSSFALQWLSVLTHF